MSRTVWKYALSPGQVLNVEGGDPRVVHVGIDPAWADHPNSIAANVPTVWVELDPEARGTQLSLSFIGTGHMVPLGKRHVGSCVSPEGLVWHVYGHSAGLGEVLR